MIGQRHGTSFLGATKRALNSLSEVTATTSQEVGATLPLVMVAVLVGYGQRGSYGRRLVFLVLVLSA